jgi:hypothetical protein
MDAVQGKDAGYDFCVFIPNIKNSKLKGISLWAEIRGQFAEYAAAKE